MIIEVELWAFRNGQIRKVTIPPSESEQRFDGVLGLAFKYGQNDFACDADLTQHLPSVSVGDVIRVYGPGSVVERFVVMPFGFKAVSQEWTPPRTPDGRLTDPDTWRG